MSYTKGEWTTGKDGLEDMIIVPSCEPVQAPGNSLEECAENAKFIVKACNSFEDLYEACKICLDTFKHLHEHNKLNDWSIHIKRLEQALSKANGKP